MKIPFLFYSGIFLIIMCITFTSCATDQDDNLKELDLKGEWKFTNINTYNYEDELIGTNDYNQLWVITNDSIKQFFSYDISGENITGTANFTLKFAYKALPDGTLIIHESIYKIKSLNENELIYRIRRSDHISETILYRVNEEE